MSSEALRPPDDGGDLQAQRLIAGARRPGFTAVAANATTGEGAT